jgi:hypothetical protein
LGKKDGYQQRAKSKSFPGVSWHNIKLDNVQHIDLAAGPRPRWSLLRCRWSKNLQRRGQSKSPFVKTQGSISTLFYLMALVLLPPVPYSLHPALRFFSSYFLPSAGF